MLKREDHASKQRRMVTASGKHESRLVYQSVVKSAAALQGMQSQDNNTRSVAVMGKVAVCNWLVRQLMHHEA